MVGALNIIGEDEDGWHLMSCKGLRTRREESSLVYRCI